MDNVKKLNTKIFKTRNIYADLFIPTIRRPEFSEKPRELIISTIFYNHISNDNNTSNDIAKLHQVIDKLKRQSTSYIVLNGKLTFKPQTQLVKVAKENLANLPQNLSDLSLAFLKIVNELNSTQNFNISDTDFFVSAMIKTLNSYESKEHKLNENTLVNLSVKLIYWYNLYNIGNLKLNLDKLTTNHNLPKIFHFEEISSHETYYLEFLSNLGFDTLIFPFKFTTKMENTQKNEPRIQNINLKNNSTPKSSANKDTRPTIISNSTSMAKPISRKKLSEGYIIKPKKFDKDLNEVLQTLSNRARYAGLPAPIIPTFFVRYIGSDYNKKQYNNKLYHFDEKLKNMPRYLKIAQPIKIVAHNELNQKTIQIWKAFSDLSEKNIQEFVESLAGISFFDFIENDRLKNQCYVALKNILNLLIKDDKIVPISKVKNILLKLSGWLIDHYTILLSTYTLEKEHSPFVLYYGDIKKHEAYYLIFLFYLGIDIIYINSFSDDVFEALDPNLEFTSLHVLETISPIDSFPESESLLQHETIAYQASEEIAQIVYNDQDGVYKPWQFESYKTMPLTLKTTYEEVSLLWNEEARIRAGFRVEKQTVYIPNLFTKISGTPEDINEYWNMIDSMSNVPLVKLYSKLPFSNIKFDTAELASIDLAFENHDRLSYDNLKNHSMYPFEHLSDALQKQIFDKINLLINENILLNKNSKYLHLKIVYTIFNLDKDLLHLIQTFDYPSNVPKLLIYDPDEVTFSESDAIIMSFLYLFGFDICVFTPTGYNNFEKFIEPSYYNIFKLTKKQFNLELPNRGKSHSSKSNNKGFWNNLFKFK